MENPSRTVASLALDPHSLHIWLTQLRPYTGDDSVDSTLLSAAELARATTFTRPQARARYLQIRREVRRRLAAYTGLQPQDLLFERDKHGKPLLTNAPFPLAFNLTHSGDYCAIAIGYDVNVGIDLERKRKRTNWPAIASRYFHPQETAQLQRQPEAQGALDFYRLWTLKEAFLKARGTGISTGLHKAAFAFDEYIINFTLASELEEDQHAWQFWQWSWADDYSLALACSATDARDFDIHIYMNTLSGLSPTQLEPASTQSESIPTQVESSPKPESAIAQLKPTFLARSRGRT